MKEMKNVYIAPEAKLVSLDAIDVITTSGVGLDGLDIVEGGWLTPDTVE